MKISNEEYARLVKARSPGSPLWKDMLRAFAVGGLICCVGQALSSLFGALGLGKEDASAAVSIAMVLLGAALSHNFKLASSAEGSTPNGHIAVGAALAILLLISLLCTFVKRKGGKK